MDIVVMAGGEGTRSRPIVAAPLNKCLIPIGNRPLIGHVLRTATLGGATRIFLTTNGKHPGLLLETVANLPDPLAPWAQTFRADEDRPGVLHDIVKVGQFLQPGQCFGMMCADTYVSIPIPFAEHSEPHLFLTTLPEQADARQFGQVICDDDYVKEFREKPPEEFSRRIFTGMSVLPYEAVEYARELTIGADETELQMSYLIDAVLARHRVRYTTLPPGTFFDCGTEHGMRQAGAAAWIHSSKQ